MKIELFLKNGVWIALMNGEYVPTPFLATMSFRDVVAKLQRRNPEAQIEKIPNRLRRFHARDILDSP